MIQRSLILAVVTALDCGQMYQVSMCHPGPLPPALAECIHNHSIGVPPDRPQGMPAPEDADVPLLTHKLRG